MRAGNLDRRITIQRKVVAQNDLGEEITTYADVATVWARKLENRGSERFTAQQVVGEAVRTFQFRWSNTVKEITDKHRIVFDGRNFDITDVREIGRREGIEVDCYARAEEPVAEVPK
jgi:SPP1 family predicted phage head-tail adaptor